MQRGEVFVLELDVGVDLRILHIETRSRALQDWADHSQSAYWQRRKRNMLLGLPFLETGCQSLHRPALENGQLNIATQRSLSTIPCMSRSMGALVSAGVR